MRIALVDDHVVLRKSLADLIERMDDYRVVMQARNGEELINALCGNDLPDIVLLDMMMPVMDGMETARWLRNHYPGIRVIALSMMCNEPLILRMVRNGIRGFILKDCEPQELQHALWQVYRQGYYYNELVTERTKMRTTRNEPGSMINEKELSFLQWSCTEKSYKEIADEMHVSPRTIDGYRDSLFQKLQVGTRVGLAMYAVRQGIVVL